MGNQEILPENTDAEDFLTVINELDDAINNEDTEKQYYLEQYIQKKWNIPSQENATGGSTPGAGNSTPTS